MASISSIIKLAGDGKKAEILQELELARQIMLDRSIRIAKRKGELSSLIVLKAIRKEIGGTTVTLKADEKVTIVYKIHRTSATDVEAFDAICDFAKAKKGKLLSATTFASYYGWNEKTAGTKFAADANKQIEKSAQFRGISIDEDKDKIGPAIAEAKTSAPATKK